MDGKLLKRLTKHGRRDVRMAICRCRTLERLWVVIEDIDRILKIDDPETRRTEFMKYMR
jgi:hypothetical protein